MGTSGTFNIDGNTSLQIDHEVNDQGELSLWFRGDLIVRGGNRFDQYLAELKGFQKIAEDPSVRHVHCHLEHLGQVLSRGQTAIYRMLKSMWDQGLPITIYATGEHPEQSEHLDMSRLFVSDLSRKSGPPLKLIEVRRAS